MLVVTAPSCSAKAPRQTLAAWLAARPRLLQTIQCFAMLSLVCGTCATVLLWWAAVSIPVKLALWTTLAVAMYGCVQLMWFKEGGHAPR